MTLITRFEELECWQAARFLAKGIFELGERGALKKDYNTRDQFRRAGVSIMNNIAEGFGRKSNREQIRYLEIAKGSANEVKSMLYLLEDIKYYKKNELHFLHSEVNKTIKLIKGFIRHLKSKK